ncbi:MAG: ROK family protein [Primorskyibacter sp.]
MTAVGLDLGGTKIEAQVLDANWQVTARQRVPTPAEYPALVTALADLIAWSDTQHDDGCIPIGIGAAGLVHPDTGLALTANICANDRPLPADIAQAAGRAVTYINDCRAMALSEAVFGAGQGHRTVMSLIMGTGIGGGIAVDGQIVTGPTRTGGEFGHCAASAAVVADLDLPLYRCGCGRRGCIETYVAGPGLTRLAQVLTGQPLTPPEIAAQRHGIAAPVWKAWCALMAELLHSLTLTVDPDIIVLGGGLSKIDGLIDALSEAAQMVQIGAFGTPPLALAQGGDTSGARGAAYAAWRAHHAS